MVFYIIMPHPEDYAGIMTASYFAASIMALPVIESYAMALRRCLESIAASHIMAYRSDSAMAMGADAVSAIIIAPPQFQCLSFSMRNHSVYCYIIHNGSVWRKLT